MARRSVRALGNALYVLKVIPTSLPDKNKAGRGKTDKYEDICGTYLIKLSAKDLSDSASEEAAGLLKIIGDFERIGDHAVNLLESAEEMKRKGTRVFPEAKKRFEGHGRCGHRNIEFDP